jgi:hypothetical protein
MALFVDTLFLRLVSDFASHGRGRMAAMANRASGFTERIYSIVDSKNPAISWWVDLEMSFVPANRIKALKSVTVIFP